MKHKKPNPGQSLADKRPEIALIWHPSRNGDLLAKDVTQRSTLKVWWKCEKGHEWEQKICNVNSCPYCTGRRVCEANCLATVNPKLAKEWHPDLNGSLTPNDFTGKSGKKLWWKCSKGHEWEAKISNRSYGEGCPYCAGKRVCDDNNLATINPLISKEWHPSRNAPLTPKDVTAFSSKKAWWKCEKGHEWKAVIGTRAKGSGCPYCSGALVSEESNLKTDFPEVASEWHKGKNGKIKPEMVRPGSQKKYWWICRNGHEWEATVGSRTLGRGCPYCTHHTSEPEIRIYTELMTIFDNVEHRKRLYRKELDIYIPTLKLGIEFDGSFYHKGKEEKDSKKNIFFAAKGITVIRVREEPLSLLSDIDVNCPNSKFTKQDMDCLLAKLTQFSDSRIKREIKRYLKSGEFQNETYFREVLSFMPGPVPSKSLVALYPDVAKEWNYKKNEPLKPENFSFGSSKKVWWKCNKGHEWEAIIGTRTKLKAGCPNCAPNSGASNDKNLLQTNPLLAKEWHPSNNGDLKPDQVTPNTHKKVWWKCTKGHEWEATVASRNAGRGCPCCNNRKLCSDNCLATVNPTLAAQWHPTKNSKTPSDYMAGSKTKVWWLCDQGHEWEAQIGSRNKGRGCPYCSGNKKLE